MCLIKHKMSQQDNEMAGKQSQEGKDLATGDAPAITYSFVGPCARMLKGKTLFITGASRGIGLAVALKAAKDGANIVIAAKTAGAHPKLPGTIYSAAEDVEKAGGKALPLIVDVRDEASVATAIEKSAQHFGGIDILINNASAISTTSTLDTTMKKYDLMHQINNRGTFMTSKYAIPYLLKSPGSGGRILTMSPPLNLDPRWVGRVGTAYTAAKYGMSLSVLGMSDEFRGQIAVNALWPKTGIATAALQMLGGGPAMMASRKPDIMADAAYWILTQPVGVTGNFFIDEEVVLTKLGLTVKDLDRYAVTPGIPLMPDAYVGDVAQFTLWSEAGKLANAVASTVGALFKGTA